MKIFTSYLMRPTILIWALIAVAVTAAAQVPEAGAERTVEGTVKDTDENLLPGVSILVKGTQRGTMTDENGFYRISLPDGSTELVFSFVGYVSQSVPIGNNSTLDITLAHDHTTLDEVVVVGYGSQSKRYVTGAIAKVDMKETENLPNTNVMQSLRGRVAGVQFTDNGRPGQGGGILIRGQRSLSGSNAPLIIVDGIQFNGSLNYLNPTDIASIEVLKDASASAIYGSRAANGVILITLKEGTTEKPTINFSAFYGRSEWANKMKLLSPERYLEKTLEMRRILGEEADPSKIRDYLADSEKVNYDMGKTTDPWDAVSQQGKVSQYTLSISGKSARTRYYLSASLASEDGLILNDKEDRMSFRSNIENHITDWLTIGMNTSFLRRDLSGVEASISSAYDLSPYGTYFHEDGEPTMYVVEGENNSSNSIRGSLLTQDEEVYNNLLAKFYMTIQFPFLKDLEFTTRYSPNYRTDHHFEFFRQDKHMTNNTTRASKFNREDFDWVFENLLTYNKQINENHGLDVTLLYGRNHAGVQSTEAEARELSVDALGWNDLALGNILTNSSAASEEDGVSSMIRVNYRLKDRYFFTFTTRRDGSSVFAADHKYATFPSGSIAWLMSEEPFLQKQSIDLLKLRVSYGAVGNQAIGRYQSLGLAGTTNYVYGDNGSTVVGVYPSSMANSDLKWETTYTANVGLDFSLLGNRIGGSVEVYDMSTHDLLVERSLPAMTGFRSIWTNLGEINNKGLEVALNTVNIRKGGFEWGTDLVFSTNRNRIVHLYGSDTDGDGKEDDDLGNDWFIGQPIDVFYDFESDGIYQETDEIPEDFKPGDRRFVDQNGDGDFKAEDDRIIVGQGQPKYRWGIGNNFSYKNLSLSVFINGLHGWTAEFNRADPNSNFGGNYPARQLNQFDNGWWTAENKSTTSPSLAYNNPLQASYYFSRNFVRIQDVVLTYTLPRAILDKLKITNLALSVSGKNLATFTEWPGTDPEAGGTVGYPMPRTVSLGVNLGF